MLDAVYFASQNLPNIRLMSALGLYFDEVSIPLLIDSDEKLKSFIEVLPTGDRKFVTHNTTFYRRYSALEGKVFSFKNPLAHEEFATKLTRDLRNLRSIASYPGAPLTLPILQHVYAMGLFHGKQASNEKRGADKVIVPLSYEIENFAIPISARKTEYLADILASIQAIEAIKVSLPDLEAIHPDEILWARDRLRDDLVPFRMSMYQMAKELKSVATDSKDIGLVKPEAEFLAKTVIQPQVISLRHRLEQERKSFARRVAIKGLEAFKLVVNFLVSPDPQKLAGLTTEAAMGLISYSEYSDKVRDLKYEATISYLAKLSELSKQPSQD